MSLYIKLFTNFWTHRKTVKLRSLIGSDAFWIPSRLWSYAAENQPNGDFSSYTAEEIALLIGYQGPAKPMIRALQQSGFLDKMKIHDWSDHNEYHNQFSERAKKAALARWSKVKSIPPPISYKIREDKRERGDKHCLGHAPSIFKKPTKEQVLAYARSIKFEIDPEYFCSHYEARGWKFKGNVQMISWKEALKSWKKNGFVKKDNFKTVNNHNHTKLRSMAENERLENGK